MLKDKSLAFSAFCLSVSIVICAIIIANGMRENGMRINEGLSSMSQGLNNIGNTSYSNENVTYGTATYNLSAASGYLGISADKIIKLVKMKDSGIPYIKIGDEYYFSKEALDKWLESARVEIE